MSSDEVQHPTRGLVAWSSLTSTEQLLFLDILEGSHPQQTLDEVLEADPRHHVVRDWRKERAILTIKEVEALIAEADGKRPPDTHEKAQRALDILLACVAISKVERLTLDRITRNSGDHFALRDVWAQKAREANTAFREGAAMYFQWTRDTAEAERVINELADRSTSAMLERHRQEVKQMGDMWNVYTDCQKEVNALALNRLKSAMDQAGNFVYSNEHTAWQLRDLRNVANIGVSPDIGDGTLTESRGRFHLSNDSMQYVHEVVRPILVDIAKKDKSGVVCEDGQRRQEAQNVLLEYTLAASTSVRELNLLRMSRIFTLYNRPVPLQWHEKVGYLLDTSVCHPHFYDLQRRRIVQEHKAKMEQAEIVRKELKAKADDDAAAQAKAAALPAKVQEALETVDEVSKHLQEAPIPTKTADPKTEEESKESPPPPSSEPPPQNEA
jgi:hypothetical protein